MISVEISVKYCKYGLYTLEYDLLDHGMEDTQSFRALSVLDNSSYKHLYMLIKETFRTNVKRC